MDSLSSINAIAELIRRKISSRSIENGSLELTRKNIEPGNSDVIRGKTSASAIKRKIISLIKDIDPDDPQREKKAVFVFVENILTWQFGSELRNDPEFSSLVKKVIDSLGSNPSIVKDILNLKD